MVHRWFRVAFRFGARLHRGWQKLAVSEGEKKVADRENAVDEDEFMMAAVPGWRKLMHEDAAISGLFGLHTTRYRMSRKGAC